jgi:hypothetical protein
MVVKALPPHDDDAARDLSLSVQIGDAAAHLRPDADVGDILQQQRGPGLAPLEIWNASEIRQVLDVTLAADEIFRLAHLDDRSAHLLIGVDNHLADHGQRQRVGAHASRIEHDLVLLDHAAEAGDLGHARHGLQFEP